VRGVLVYLVGEPGAGKTTALRELTAGYAREQTETAGCPVMRLTWKTTRADLPVLPSVITEIGKDREGFFGGTDALAMNIAPKATEALSILGGLVIAEGDRLAHDGFLFAAQDAGWRVRVAALTTPRAMAAARRAERGGGQNETWVKGRRTKAVALARRWDAFLVDGALAPKEIAVALAGEIVRVIETARHAGYTWL